MVLACLMHFVILFCSLFIYVNISVLVTLIRLLIVYCNCQFLIVLLQEIKVLSQLKHQNIVQYYGSERVSISLLDLVWVLGLYTICKET